MPRMDGTYKKEIAVRMTTRAATGLYFIEDFLSDSIHGAKDGAYFRSLCILLSYSFELLLKAQFVMTREFVDKKSLESELRDLNHNIVRISTRLGTVELDAIGIKSVTPRTSSSFVGYVIQTKPGKKIVIEDFIDIRYDFTKDALRNLPENDEFIEWKDEALAIYNKIKKLHF